MSTPNMTEVLKLLQDIQERYLQIAEKYENHNIDVEAHQYILNEIKKLKSSDNLYTNEQITEKINELLNEHKRTDFKNAHAGWTEYETTLKQQLSNLETRITSLENWKDSGGFTGGSGSLLFDEMQKIEAEYAKRIATIQQAISEATANNDAQAVARLNNEILILQKEKVEKINELIANWESGEVA